MRFIQSAAVLSLLLATGEAIRIDNVQSENQSTNNEKLPKDKKLIDSKIGSDLFGEEKEKYLTDKITKERKQLDEVSEKLTQIKIEVETDETMLIRHKQEMEDEQSLIKNLNQKVQSRNQTIAAIEKKNNKKQQLIEKAHRLAKNEQKVREKVQQQIKQRIISEAELAKKQGQVEAKHDPEMLKQMKLDALRKAEEAEIEEENDQIQSLAQANEKKHKQEGKGKGKKTLAQAYDAKYPNEQKSKYDLPENAGNFDNVDNTHQQRDVLSTGHKYDPQGKTHFQDAAMQPGNGKNPVMFSQGKQGYVLPENAQNLPNVDNDHQQRDVLSTGHKYGPQGKTHFEDHAMQPGNGKHPVMFSQNKYVLPENAQNLPNVDNDHQQRDVLSTGHKYDPQSKTHFQDHAMQPGNGKYPVMFNQNKAHAHAHAHSKAKGKDGDDEEETGEDTGDEADSEQSEGEENEEAAPVQNTAPNPVAEQVREDNEEVVPVVTQHMSKADRDAYYNTDELKGFAQEEDRSIKEQLDGQQLIQQTGPTLIKEVNTEIKNATPNWVSGKWVKNMKNAAKNAQKREANKKAKKASMAQKRAKKI